MGKVKIKFIRNIALIFLIIIILSLNTFAIGLGVSPAKLNYNNVLKGGYAQNSLYISTDTPDNLSMFFEFSGDIAPWLSIEGNITNITISKNSPKQVKIIIQPPLDTANGNYSGYVRVITDKITNSETGIGSAVKAAFMVNIYATITGDEIISCSGGGIDVSDAEINFPNTIYATIKNEGNVRLSPDITVDIWDKYQTKIIYSTILSTQSILPTESVRITKEILANLDVEQYWAEIKIPQCKVSSTTTINIIEKGGISDTGELVRIDNKAWAKTQEIIQVNALFKNTGARIVTAQFKGEVLYNGEIVKIIDTDKIDAEPGETIELSSFFKPEQIGQYYIQGRIHFNNKITTEKASVLNVNPGEAINNINKKSYIIYYILIIIIISIFLMLILIKKKKHIVNHKRKRHH